LNIKDKKKMVQGLYLQYPVSVLFVSLKNLDLYFSHRSYKWEDVTAKSSNRKLKKNESGF
jgi:hypothetical protein